MATDGWVPEGNLTGFVGCIFEVPAESQTAFTKPYEFIWFGAMYVTKPCEFIGFGAMDVTKPYEFMRFGARPGTG